VLWVRSYWICDVAYGGFGFPGYLQIDSNHGDIKLIANAEFKQKPARRMQAGGYELRIGPMVAGYFFLLSR